MSVFTYSDYKTMTGAAPVPKLFELQTGRPNGNGEKIGANPID